MIKNERITIIVGLSGVGKSTYAKSLAEKMGIRLISTDEYLQYGDYGSEDALHILTGDVVREKGRLIVEGSLCYRLLRNGLRDKNFNAELIIHVGASVAIRQLRRPEKDYSKTDHIYKVIWADYLHLLKYYGGNPRIEWVDTTNLI